tara:strand:+ start:5742 stop:5882 length:141 start_codon:yes stop_codon:yes gene_type:complete
MRNELKQEDFDSVVEVKELAFMFGLKVSGKKQAIIDRINNYLRSQQ